METRAIVAIALSMLVLFVFQYFFIDRTAIQGNNATNTAAQAPDKKNTGEHIPDGHISFLSDASIKQAAQGQFQTADKYARDITVDTDLYHAVISEQGAAFRSFLLKRYTTSINGDEYVDLVTVTPPLLPGVIELKTSNGTFNLAKAFFKADRETVNLSGKSTNESATITFTLNLDGDTTLERNFTFRNGTYWIDTSVNIKGAYADSSAFILYDRPFNDVSRYIFSGPSYMTNGSLEEVTLEEIGEKQSVTGTVDWMSYGDNYFMNAVIPLEGSMWQLDFTKLDDNGLTESRISPLTPSKDTGLLKLGLYFGPKEIDRLNNLGHNLSGVINFGWFDIIAKPLLYLLKFIYTYMGNYGIAIIIVTIAIKLAFWPLAQKSARSMKTMQKLQPKLKKLKDKYGDDKEKLNKEMMQLYRTYNVNPMSGCMPMLIQIPVFFALYKVLLQSIELRHAPFILWINDLSSPDRLMIPGIDIPYLHGIPVLTLLMGASMYLQQKLSPSSLDPAQAKMMQFLPVIFTFMFLSFPSGLVLYWFINNILSIAQQYYVNKYTD